MTYLWPGGGEVRGEEQGGGQGGHQAGAAQHRPGPGNADDKESNLFWWDVFRVRQQQQEALADSEKYTPTKIEF